MPVEYRTGNLFDFKGSLAHGTNGDGVMGKGIAVEFKQQFGSGFFKDYQALCKEGKHLPGMIHAHQHTEINFTNLMTGDDFVSMSAPVSLKDSNFNNLIYQSKMQIKDKYIYNICIKPHWRMKAETYAIWAGLRAAIKHLEVNKNEYMDFELAMPAIGGGLGRLDWETQVKPIIEEIGKETSCNLIVYLQSEAKENESNIDDPHDADSAV